MALDNLPGDPMMLLSFVNTRLRDDGINIDEFAAQFDVDRKDIEEKLDKIGYTYNNELNRFV
ncbi:MAG: DUF4250 domain-containing protein [Wujia sp.]